MADDKEELFKCPFMGGCSAKRQHRKCRNPKCCGDPFGDKGSCNCCYDCCSGCQTECPPPAPSDDDYVAPDQE